MMKILNSFSLKPEQRQTLEAAGHTVIDGDKLDDA
ncbi:D-3-phosphoglycerate dehydrogenase, partial [Lacticaseibacillus paracasei subsp. paracasei Lpp41]